MKRGEVIDYVIEIPMKIKIQSEGDKIVAVLPAYHLPLHILVEEDDMETAIEALRDKVLLYWRGI
jgi:hypothetical protein